MTLTLTDPLSKDSSSLVDLLSKSALTQNDFRQELAAELAVRSDTFDIENRELAGTYAGLKKLIENARDPVVRSSPELIQVNAELAKWESHLGVGKVASFPVNIGFNITDVCNARCDFCAYAPERVSEQLLTLERLRALDWLKFCRVFRPNGGGLGEPFAHPRIGELFETLQSIAPHIRINIISNGSIVRDKLLKVIVGYVDFLYVSMNGATKETYEQIMPPLKWDRLIRNLTAIRDEKIRRNTHLPRMAAGFVVHKQNLFDLPKFPRVLREIGVEELNVKPMVPPPSCSVSAGLRTQADSIFTIPDEADQVFRELEGECRRWGITISRPLPSLDVLRTDGLKTTAQLLQSRKLSELGIDKGETLTSPHQLTDLNTLYKDQSAFRTSDGNATDRELVEENTTLDSPLVFKRIVEAGTIPVQSSNGIDKTSTSEVGSNKHSKNKTDVSIIKAPRRFVKNASSGVNRKIPLSIGKTFSAHDTADADKAEEVEEDAARLAERWSLYMVPNAATVCAAPWQTLKINAFSNTRMCCSYFENMPEFDWPGTFEFHDESKMWNHPFMQHLRQTMGTKQEVSFCSLCQGRDKSGLPAREAKRKATEESQALFQGFIDKTEQHKRRGLIDSLVTPLEDFRLSEGSKGAGQIVFTNSKAVYRRRVRIKGFTGLDKVMQLGVGRATLSPFLAESCEKFFIADVNAARLTRAQSILAALDLDSHTSFIAANRSLELDSSSLSAAWVNGRVFQELGRNFVLELLADKIKEGGRLQVDAAPGIGMLIERIIDATSEDTINELLRSLSQGSDNGGDTGYFGIASLMLLLREFGFSLDKSRPPSQRFIGNYSAAPPLGLTHSALAKNLTRAEVRQKICDDSSLITGYERCISFSAIKN